MRGKAHQAHSTVDLHQQFHPRALAARHATPITHVERDLSSVALQRRRRRVGGWKARQPDSLHVQRKEMGAIFIAVASIGSCRWIR